jgi:hypothetical protein
MPGFRTWIGLTVRRAEIYDVSDSSSFRWSRCKWIFLFLLKMELYARRWLNCGRRVGLLPIRSLDVFIYWGVRNFPWILKFLWKIMHFIANFGFWWLQMSFWLEVKTCTLCFFRRNW